MHIRNINPLGAVDVPLLGRVVDAGEVIEVSDQDAAALLPQATNWASVEDIPDAAEPEPIPDVVQPEPEPIEPEGVPDADAEIHDDPQEG